MKRLLFLSLLCTLLMVGCNNGEDEHRRTKLLIASKYGYVIGGDTRPIPMPIVQVVNDEGGEQWKASPLIGVELLNYEEGYEYTVWAHKESYMPDEFPEHEDVLWWKIDKVIDKVEKDTELPDNVFIYTIGSPWGFDPRDPMLEYMLEHYKEIFGEDCEIYYPTKI